MKLYLRDFTFWEPIAEDQFLANVATTDEEVHSYELFKELKAISD